eukprot:m.109938 g.109938  ORF g.109938 m.109938 type:complete len:90 (-) comp9324_c1_seq1:27-296(-)
MASLQLARRSSPVLPTEPPVWPDSQLKCQSVGQFDSLSVGQLSVCLSGDGEDFNLPTVYSPFHLVNLPSLPFLVLSCWFGLNRGFSTIR